jgi:hypothetical protein
MTAFLCVLLSPKPLGSSAEKNRAKNVYPKVFESGKPDGTFSKDARTMKQSRAENKNEEEYYIAGGHSP